MDDADAFLPQLFGRLPHVPVAVESSDVRAGYKIPTRDGTLPGIFLVNSRANHPMYRAKWFVWHEAVPGHHLQFAIEHERQVAYYRDLLFLSGYIEGWATYTEMLPLECGLVDDPRSFLVSLYRHLILAARVVMDIGLNYMGWSELEAIQYFQEVTGFDPENLISGVISSPGRSAAYCAGMLKFRQLRETAKEDLGAAFDLREFHDRVLEYGSMPLDVLEVLADEYIQEKK